uniref:Uncharacterized protein n=1 Tax=Laticauda laticaudata TaxID=8630 RepID=A0A8C5RKG7_LATLA
MGELRVEDRLPVLPQALHLHARDGLAQALELAVPGGGSCGGNGERLPRLRVPVEEPLPQDLVPGHPAPLPAHPARRQHARGREVAEDLDQEAVGEHGRILPPGRPDHGGSRRERPLPFPSGRAPPRCHLECRRGPTWNSS